MSGYFDRHGKRRYHFRRKGYPAASLNAPYGSKEFERLYAACLQAEPITVGAERTVPGSVADAISRYYSDSAFQDLRPATQQVYRGVLERFRENFGDDPIRRFDADRIQKLMTRMRHKPHAAVRLRKLLTQLFTIARRAKLVPFNFDPVKDTKPPKAETIGFHRWTEAELAAFEQTHRLGTKPRLAFAMLLYCAQRSGDVRLLTREIVKGGRVSIDQSKTSNAVDVPIVEPLREALDAGPLGNTYLLENKFGDHYSPKGFSQMIKKACRKAGIPHCSAHGLRKSAARRCMLAGCTHEEGMAITGHKTVKEYLRYAGDDGSRAARADAAMRKVMANLPEKLDNNQSQPTEKA